jgi:hypothetical protein
MAEQADRVYKRKTITLPDGTTKIDVPVLYQSKFGVAADQHQDQWAYFDNSAKSSRKVHVQNIYLNGKKPVNGDGGGSFIQVERIDSFFVKIMAEGAQEYEYPLTNKDPPPIQLDGTNSPAHERTHVVRYYPNNESSGAAGWLDVELIDELKVSCAADQYQEWRIICRHPDLGDPVTDSHVPYNVTIGFCDPSFEQAPDDSQNGIDPPYRLDPFRNIVNLQNLQSFSYEMIADFLDVVVGGFGDNPSAPIMPPGAVAWAPDFIDSGNLGGIVGGVAPGDILSGFPGSEPEWIYQPIPSGEFPASVDPADQAIGAHVTYDYTEGAPLPGFFGWNDKKSFTVNWVNGQHFAEDTTLYLLAPNFFRLFRKVDPAAVNFGTQTIDLTGATVTKSDGTIFNVAGTAAGRRGGPTDPITSILVLLVQA